MLNTGQAIWTLSIELFVIIFNRLCVADLRSLTQVCQLFAEITLKTYLERSGVPVSSDAYANLQLASHEMFTASRSLLRAKVQLRLLHLDACIASHYQANCFCRFLDNKPIIMGPIMIRFGPGQISGFVYASVLSSAIRTGCSYLHLSCSPMLQPAFPFSCVAAMSKNDSCRFYLYADLGQRLET